ncbi:MAG: hypothetical protein ACFFDI_29630, partial [Promethearchaeota archaeon]
FTIKLSSPTDSPNYYVSWVMPISTNEFFETYAYSQTGQFRDFDLEGTFDCTHGFDQCDIEIEDVTSYLLQENSFFLLQETGERILL